MKKKYLLAITTMLTLAVGAVAFSAANQNNFNAIHDSFAEPQTINYNRLGLRAAYGDDAGGIVSTNANKDFVLSVNDYASDTDAWKVKILMDNLALESGNFYMASMTVSSSVSHDAFFVAEENQGTMAKKLYSIDGETKNISIVFKAERNNPEVQLQVGEFKGATITVSDAKVEKLSGTSLGTLTYSGRVDGDFYTRNNGSVIDRNNVTIGLNSGASDDSNKSKLKPAVIVSKDGRLNLVKSKMYRLKYTVGLNVDFPDTGVNILLGGYPTTITPEYAITDQILGINGDNDRLNNNIDLSHYGVKATFTQEVAFRPISDFYDLAILLECANIDSEFEVIFTNIILEELVTTGGEAAVNTYRAEKFANEWRALRDGDDRLCETVAGEINVLNSENVRNKIAEYANLPKAVRDVVDPMIDVEDYTIGTSILAFAARLDIELL